MAAIDDEVNNLAAGIGNLDINRRHIKFTTINCSGGPNSTVPNKPTRRCDLLSLVFEEADVVAIQELEFKEELGRRLRESRSHHMLYERGSRNLVCMLLRISAFPNPEIAPTYDFRQFPFGQCLLVNATPNGWNNSVKFVSYHGTKRNKTDQQKIQGVVDLVTWLQSDEVPNADCIMIGGDFNLDATHMNSKGLPEIRRRTGLQLHVASCGRPGRLDDSVRHDNEQQAIDYFIYYNGALHVHQPTRRKFDRNAFGDDLSYDWQNERGKYETLQKYLDHDPITVELQDPPAEPAPPVAKHVCVIV